MERVMPSLPFEDENLPLFTVGQVSAMLEIQQAFLRLSTTSTWWAVPVVGRQRPVHRQRDRGGPVRRPADLTRE